MVNMNTVCGSITNVAPGPQANQSLVTIDQTLEDVDQYENGLLRLGPPPARQFNALGNTAGVNATVRVQNDAGGAPPVNQPFDLHDDDNDAVLPRLPDLGWMQDSDNPQQNLFAWAYIRPVDDGGGGTTGEQGFPFDVNTEDDNEALNESYYTKRQSTNSNSNDYWVVYLLSAFQGPVFRDGDPNDQPARIGVCSFVGQAPGTICGNVLLFYVEAYRDACGGLDTAPGIRSGLQATVVHEVGHSFGADLFHTEGGIMAQGCLKAPQFTEITLNRIRSAQRPGGGAF